LRTTAKINNSCLAAVAFQEDFSFFTFQDMKYLLPLAFVLSLSLNAQETQRTFRFGLKAAPVIAWMKPEFKDLPAGFSIDGGGARIGFAWGPVAEFALNETFLFSTGLDITYTSGKLKGRALDLGTANAYDYEQLYKLRFIDLPAMLKFRTKEIGYLRYFGLFGFGAGFRYSARTEFSEFRNGTQTITADEHSSSYVNLFRGSLLVGAGVEYNLSGNTSLVTSLVFNNGLTNILKNQTPLPPTQFTSVREDAINNYFQLNVGILF